MSTAKNVVRSFYTAIEEGCHGDQLAAFLAPGARTIERPNALVPTGRVSDRTTMLANSTTGAGLLVSQTYRVRSLVEVDGTVAARLTWTAVVAQDAGPFAAGQQLTAHIAQFIRVRDGLIEEIETYDCYEPFTSQ